MAFKKRVSPDLVKAEERVKKLGAINSTLEVGGLTLPAYQGQVDAARTLLDRYNALLTEADLLADQFDNAETGLKDWSERMLAGVGVKYGKDSPEYEAAGGVRKSERKKPVRKTTKAEG
jgi:hypothetical protein